MKTKSGSIVRPALLMAASLIFLYLIATYAKVVPMLAGGTFAVIFQWVIHNGYPIMFVAMVFEGPMLAAAASFAAKFGYFNLGIIFLLVVSSDIVGDFIWFTLGYFGRVTFVRRYGRYFGATEERMEKLRGFIERHPWKTIAAIKLAPLLPAPGLIVAGSSHMSPKKFLGVIVAIILPKTVLFMSLGYFLGYAYDAVSKYVENGIYGLVIVAVVIYGVYSLYKRLAGKVSEELEEESR